MAFIIYKVKKATIGIDEMMIKCPSCETDSFADVMITSNYYHMFFIPMFPFEKEANIICQQCGMRRYEVPFNARTFKNYQEVKQKFRHPWYTYFFCIVMALVILITVIFTV